MLDPNDTLDGTYPFAPRFSRAPGFAMHYVDEGAGDPILCLHGEPAWSYLYREIVPRLAARHRVIAPDYMGFGKSETPSDRAYTPDAHVDALERLVLALDLRRITLVAHDWGGHVGGRVALRHPGRIARLVVMNAALPLGLPVEAERLAYALATTPYFEWMRSLERRGVMDTVLGEFGMIIPAIMQGLQGVERAVDATWRRAYGAPFATPAEAVGAIAFPRAAIARDGAPVAPDPAAVAALRGRPAIMIEGMKDRVLPPDDMIAIFEAQFPGAPIHRLTDAGHFLQEDAPETIALLIEQFIALTPTEA